MGDVGSGADESVSVVFSRVKQKHSVMLLLLLLLLQPNSVRLQLAVNSPSLFLVL